MNLQEKTGEKLGPQTNTAGIIPLGELPDIGSLDRIVNPLTPYSDLAVYALPSEISETYVTYSGGDYTSWDSVLEVLAYNQRYRVLVDSGRGIFLPSSFVLHDETAFSSSTNLYQPPFAQSAENFRFIPENPPTAWMGKPPTSDILVYHKLLLPYFPSASLKDLAEIADRETEAFQLFTSYLSRRLRAINGAESRADLEGIIDEINDGVAKLNIDAKKLSRTKFLRGAQVSFFTVSVGALLLHDSQLVKEVAGLIGSMNVLQLLQEVIGQQKESLELRKSEFFIPYLLSKEHQQR